MKPGTKFIAAILVLLIQVVAVGPERQAGSQVADKSLDSATSRHAVPILMADTGDYYVGANRPT